MNTTIHTIEQLRRNQLMLKITHILTLEFSSTELHSSKEDNDKDPKFKVGDHVRISKYKNIVVK